MQIFRNKWIITTLLVSTINNRFVEATMSFSPWVPRRVVVARSDKRWNNRNVNCNISNSRRGLNSFSWFWVNRRGELRLIFRRQQAETVWEAKLSGGPVACYEKVFFWVVRLQVWTFCLITSLQTDFGVTLRCRRVWIVSFGRFGLSFCCRFHEWLELRLVGGHALYWVVISGGGAFDSAENHKRQRRKRQFVTAKREMSQTPKFV